MQYYLEQQLENNKPVYFQAELSLWQTLLPNVKHSFCAPILNPSDFLLSFLNDLLVYTTGGLVLCIHDWSQAFKHLQRNFKPEDGIQFLHHLLFKPLAHLLFTCAQLLLVAIRPITQSLATLYHAVHFMTGPENPTYEEKSYAK